jgi:membrane associated rhomboid family serine protease
MFIPLGDDNSDRRIQPVVNYTLIGLNILVFIFLQGMGSNLPFTYSLSTVPQEILTGTDVVTQGSIVSDPATGERYRVPGLGVTPLSVYLTLLTSMFMHGGSGGGVAYGAHIGGFIAGLILVKFFLIGVYSKGRLSFP